MPATKVTLPATLKIDNVDDVLGRLKTALGKKKDTVVLEAAQVSAVDFAGLQLLMVFAHHCKAISQEFKLNAASDELSQAITDVGAGELLGVA